MKDFIKVDKYWIRHDGIKILIDETKEPSDILCTIVTSERMSYSTKLYKCEDILKMIDDKKKEKE